MDSKLADSLGCACAYLLLPKDPTDMSQMALLRAQLRSRPHTEEEGASAASALVLCTVTRIVQSCGCHTGAMDAAGVNGVEATSADCSCEEQSLSAAQLAEHAHRSATEEAGLIQEIRKIVHQWIPVESMQYPESDGAMRKLANAPPGQDAFLHASVAELFLGLQQFSLMPCMQPLLSSRVVKDVTRRSVHRGSGSFPFADVEAKAHLFVTICENIRAFPQPEQDVLHAFVLVFGPLLRRHACRPAKIVQAWLGTLLCRV
eukprot:jgi/Ulvmu1/5078/UM021_0095.1